MVLKTTDSPAFAASVIADWTKECHFNRVASLSKRTAFGFFAIRLPLPLPLWGRRSLLISLMCHRTKWLVYLKVSDLVRFWVCQS